MKRIIFSLTLIAGTVGALWVGGTGAFFSDIETSTGNVFTAGAIDLKIDSTQHYNGNVCVDVAEGDAVNYQWVGESAYPVPGTTCNGTWTLTDLGITNQFFDFDDIKPGDEGENTISLHIDSNPAWACADVAITANDDMTCTEPELALDPTCLATPADLNTTDGELAQNLMFVAWNDNDDDEGTPGDNVHQAGETFLFDPGPASDVLNGGTLTLADGSTGSPLPGGTTSYIGLAWCAGTMTASEGGGQPTCDGSTMLNNAQTDSMTADITFRVEQARNNPDFRCDGEDGPCEISEVQTIIPNSTFEVPVVVNAANWDAFSSPAGNWNVEWRGDVPATFGDQTRPNPAKLEIHKGVVGTPNEGLQYAELDSDWAGPDGGGDGEPASISIYQDVPTIAGENYRIKFVWAARPNTPAADNRVGVEWNNVQVYDSGTLAGGGGDIVWNEIVIDVAATGPVTRLRFTDLGTANSIGTFIDNIRLYSEECNLPVEIDV